jgi:FO synthase
MHALSRLVLHPHISNIQASWVKMGTEGVKACLHAGVNDLGGTLINESITRAAGASHGQCVDGDSMYQLAQSSGRELWQRTTLYNVLPDSLVAATGILSAGSSMAVHPIACQPS